MYKISVVGTGYVGLTTGVCFAHLGHSVSCIDVDEEKVRRLRAGDVPIFEPGIEQLVRAGNASGGLSFTTSYEEGLADAQFVFIAVGTPISEDGRAAEMRFVYDAASRIARSLRSPAIIVNKSTSPIGTGENIRRVLEENNPELSPWVVVSNPEFLREGNAVDDCLHPARIVLGATKPEDCDAVAALYSSFPCPTIKTDLHTAEMIKYASNAFLATKISFINEVARICDALDADVTTVAEGMGLDARIGRPMLGAGLGYGGSCFPKDVAALAHMADTAGLHPQLLKAVVDINDDQRRWAVEALRECLSNLTEKVVAIWGLAFKPDTDDLRSAPAVEIGQRLLAEGASLRIYDPVVGSAELAGESCASPIEAARGADAILIATEWQEFRETDWRSIASVMRGAVVFDGRNCLDPDVVAAAGLTYKGVGRRRTVALAADTHPVTGSPKKEHIAQG